MLMNCVMGTTGASLELDLYIDGTDLTPDITFKLYLDTLFG